MRKLKCFVASAFKKPDVNIIYKKGIVPVLNKLYIKHVRMDRVNHNEDINIRIIKEMKRCDFAICDLTYARPSVYYEAGYVECNKPIVYVCREDHFNKKCEFEIHFDLKPKPVIDWGINKLGIFRKQLAKRTKLVTKPIIAKLRIEDSENKLQEEYRQMPRNEKYDELFRICVSNLRHIGFKGKNEWFYGMKHSDDWRAYGVKRRNKNIIDYVMFLFVDRNKNVPFSPRYLIREVFRSDYAIQSYIRDDKNRCTLIVVPIGSLTNNSILKKYPNYRKRQLKYNTSLLDHNKAIHWTIKNENIFVCNKVQSKSDLNIHLKEICKHLRNKR